MKLTRLLFLVALGVAGGLLLRYIAVEGVSVASPSMEPTLPVGTEYFADKVSYLFRGPRRGEIVVLDSPLDDGKGLIKRVIGLPGETIEMKDKKVYIDGQPLQEPYARYARAEEVLEGDNLAPLRIPEDAYFVLGDNRDESKDSATWKNARGERVYFVPRKLVKGRLMNVIE